MNYHNITHDDMLNGTGLRVVLWVAGCSHHCKECQNPITWDPNGGIPFDKEAHDELMGYLARDHISGITFSGGDPLHPGNREKVGELVEEVHKNFGGTKDIWMYTGYLWEDVKDLPFMQYVSVLAEGEYVAALRDTALHWVGSSNQTLVDVPASLEAGKLVIKAGI